MKKLILMLALAVGVTSANAQTTVDSISTENTKLTLTKDAYSHLEENGDLFQGLTKRIGFDRMIMLMTNSESIRDVIAFPKTQTASCLLTEAPGLASNEQLDELHIKFHGLEKEKK